MHRSHDLLEVGLVFQSVITYHFVLKWINAVDLLHKMVVHSIRRLHFYVPEGCIIHAAVVSGH
jgi:hypothetical protein